MGMNSDMQDGMVRIWSSTIDSELNLISAGHTDKSTAATNLGSKDWLIMKHGHSGELIWQRQIGSTASDLIYDVDVDSDDNIYVWGTTGVATGGTFDGNTITKKQYGDTRILAKYDKDGERKWLKIIDDSTDTSGVTGGGLAMNVEECYLCCNAFTS